MPRKGGVGVGVGGGVGGGVGVGGGNLQGGARIPSQVQAAWGALVDLRRSRSLR